VDGGGGLIPLPGQGFIVSLARRTTALSVTLLALVLLLAACSSSGTSRIKLPVDAIGNAPPAAATSSTDSEPTATPLAASPAPSPTVDPNYLWMELDPDVVAKGGALRAQGAGFAPSEGIVISLIGPKGSQSIALGEVAAGAKGAFAGFDIRLPASVPPGTWTMRATGKLSGAVVERKIYVQASKPELDLESTTMRQGAKLKVSAVGFNPQDSLSLMIKGIGGKPLLQAGADRGGNLMATEAQLPILPAGDYTLVLQSKDGKRQATRIVSVVARTPWVILDPYAMRPGQSVSFSGYDFIPGDEVKVILDGNSLKPLSKITVNDAGFFGQSAAWTPAAKDVGKHTLTFVSQHAQPVSVQFEVLTRNPSFGMSTYAGRPGSKVSFNGKGFAPNETIHVLLGDAQKEVASFDADKDGAFSGAGEITIPLDAQGTRLKVTLLGDQSQVPVSLEFNLLSAEPWVGLSTYAGERSTAVYLDGHGFGPGEEVDVYINGQAAPLAKAQANANGEVDHLGPIAVPAGAGTGRLTFTLKGTQTGAQASVDFTVLETTATPGPTATPSR